jgi:predicted permease
VLYEIASVVVASGMLAVFASRWLFDGLLQQVPRVAYGNAPVGIDLRVGLIAIGCGLAGALVFAFVPVWRATQRDVQTILRGHATRATTARSSLGRPLVAAQVALSVALVFAAVLTAKALIQVLSVPLGFDPDRVVMFTPPIPAGADRREFTASLLTRIRQHPAVIAAGAAGHVPFDGAAPDEGAQLPGVKTMRAGISYILPGFPEALGIPLSRGRLLSADDARSDVDAALVSQAAARALFGELDPVGRLFQSSSGRTLHVVGVVADVRDNLSRETPPAAYVIPTAGRRPLRIVLRLRDRDDAVVEDLRAQLGLPKGSGGASPWFADQIGSVAEYRNPRFQTTVLLIMGGAALLLTVCGIVGVVGFQVASRTRELGIRMVVGARPVALVRGVLRQSTAPVVFGLAGGLGATYWIGKLAEAQLFRVDGTDPVALGITAVIVLVAATAAAWVPARRAGRVDPVVALRAD